MAAARRRRRRPDRFRDRISGHAALPGEAGHRRVLRAGDRAQRLLPAPRRPHPLTMPPLRLAAAWVLPVVGPPIRDGAVLIGKDGRISVVGPGAEVPSPPGVPAARYGGVLLPGLVNAHTHLELTGLRDVAPPEDFPGWIRTIRRLKEARRPAEYLDAARAGLRACWAGGVTTVADTGDSGAVIEALSEA